MTATLHGVPSGGPIQTRIAEDTVITGTVRGVITMKHDVHLEISSGATVQGTVSTEHDATLVIRGSLQGEVEIAPSSSVIVFGALMGEIVIGDRAVLDIQPGGSVAGNIINRGLLSNAGTRGGDVIGNDPQDVPGARVIRPKIVNGETVYDM